MIWLPLAAYSAGLYAARQKTTKEDPDPGTDPPCGEYPRTKDMKSKPKKPKGGKKGC